MTIYFDLFDEGGAGDRLDMIKPKKFDQVCLVFNLRILYYSFIFCKSIFISHTKSCKILMGYEDEEGSLSSIIRAVEPCLCSSATNED